MTRRRVDQETDVELLKKGRCDHVNVISFLAHHERNQHIKEINISIS